jgi:hypothetical protein
LVQYLFVQSTTLAVAAANSQFGDVAMKSGLQTARPTACTGRSPDLRDLQSEGLRIRLACGFGDHSLGSDR